MRKVSAAQVLCFVLLTALALAAGYPALRVTWVALERVPELRGPVSVVVGVVVFYVGLIVLRRLVSALRPLPVGDIAEGSAEEFVYHVCLLTNLIFFFPVMSSFILPVPLMRLLYQSLGARFGTNSYPGGVVLDPQFVSVGDDTLIGRDALLIPHVIEGRRLAHFPIRIGNRVTIGARAIVMAGAEIGDDVVIAVNSVVGKGQRIPAGEIWGGTPARKLGGHDSTTSGAGTAPTVRAG